MSREGSQTQEGRKGEGQVEGRREANTAEEEADATGDRTGPSHRLGRPHEPDELVEGARLKCIFREFLFAVRRRTDLFVMMAWTYDQVVIHLALYVVLSIVLLYELLDG